MAVEILNFLENALSLRRPMLSLRKILIDHAPVLVIDAASSLIQVGLFSSETESIWETSTSDSGIGIFAATQQILSRSGLTFAALRGFIFCEGPGSILGIRTSAVALRTWNVISARPIFRFSSLQIVAFFQQRQRSDAPFSVIADARRETWHLMGADGSGAPSSLRRVGSLELNGKLLMPAHFRTWAAVPASTEIVAYSLEEMFPPLLDTNLFSETAAPDAFLHEDPAYATWAPRIHQASAP